MVTERDTTGGMMHCRSVAMVTERDTTGGMMHCRSVAMVTHAAATSETSWTIDYVTVNNVMHVGVCFVFFAMAI